MSAATDLVRTYNREYEALHTAKEDAFWALYMGLTGDPEAAQKDFDRKEIALQRWLTEPARLQAAEAALAEASGLDDDDRLALEGWVRTLRAQALSSPEARALAERIVEAEGALGRARGGMKLGYELDGDFHEASSVKLSLLVRSDRSEAVRKAAWQGLRSIESFVLDSGLIEVVKLRNELARMHGCDDYYDWKVRRVEGMSKVEIFALLDELEEATRPAAERRLEALRAEHGDAVTAWNIGYLVSGDITEAQDPYFRFQDAVDSWGRSFAALGIDYNGAELVLDLVERKGKYENGFMHGPVPAWRDGGTFRPARIQFTANAVPGQVGSGRRALETLLHEGGHAAHFANIDMPSPCFAQEFAPTSVAFAETQSMFLDSLAGDADWQRRYARNAAGEAMPVALIEAAIRAKQPSAAWGLRSMLVVPYAERAIYELPDDQLTPETIRQVIRAVEKRLLMLEDGSPRPVLSVPHLLSGESSAYYHGYVLAEMAVYQTRHFFESRDGHLVDNPRIGPDLARVYWKPGNSRTFNEFVEALTGEPLTATYLARHATRTVDEALAAAHAKIEREPSLPRFERAPDLGGTVHIRHGNEEIASTARGGFNGLARDFAAWLDRYEAAASRT